MHEWINMYVRLQKCIATPGPFWATNRFASVLELKVAHVPSHFAFLLADESSGNCHALDMPDWSLTLSGIVLLHTRHYQWCVASPNGRLSEFDAQLGE